MWCTGWGSLISARLTPIGAWAERQGLEFAAECYLALIHQCAHLLQVGPSCCILVSIFYRVHMYMQFVIMSILDNIFSIFGKMFS